MASGELYIVATPIGNLGDISARACEVLAAVDVVAAEDTRHSGRLLQHLGVTTPLRAYHDFSDADTAAELLQLLSAGKRVALISDAGTPLIADPGFRLVQAARRDGHKVIPVPGPSALLAALSVAGIPSDRFVFEGFLPQRAAARRTRLAELKDEPRTLIFYETPHRILSCLTDMQTVLGGDRPLFVARELTKKFETHHLGTIADTLHRLTADPNQQRGEFTLVLSGADKAQASDTALQHALEMAEVLQQELSETLSPKQMATILSRLTAARKNALYQALIKRQQP